jgi:hypothetical protein
MHLARQKRLSLIILISLVLFFLPRVAQAETNLLQETGRITAYAVSVEGEYIYIIGEAVNFQGEVDLDLSGGMKDIWLAKLRIDGTPVFTALIGGSDDDAAYGIAVREGVVYILGETWSEDFPGPPGNAGENDALLLALAADGEQVLWARRFGGSDQDAGRALTLFNGSLYLTGITWSEDLTTDAGLGDVDGFLARVGLNGHLDWLQTFGGSALDAPYDLMVTEDEIWVAGQSFSRNFGGTHQGQGDIFAARFDLDGEEQFAMLFGDREADIAFAISPGDSGEILIAGGTRSDGLPGAVGEFTENYDGFLIALSSDGDVQRTSYFGGIAVEYAYYIALMPDGNVLVVGETNSPEFPLGDAQPQIVNGEGDAFIIQINQDGEIVQSLLKGGPGGEYARDAVLTSSGLWLAGKFDMGGLTYGLLVPPSELGLSDLPTEEPALPTATLVLTATPQPTETPRPTPTATDRPSNPQTAIVNAVITATVIVDQSTETEVLDVSGTSVDVADQTSEMAEFTSTPSLQEEQVAGDAGNVPHEKAQIEGGYTGWIIGSSLLIILGLAGAYYWYQRKKRKNIS